MSTKKFFQILAVSTTALITACEEQFTSFDSETPITVTTLVSENTRAGYDNSNLPDKFIMSIDQEGDNYDYSCVEMTPGGQYDYSYTAPDDVFLVWKGNGQNTRASIKAMTLPYNLTAIDPDNTMTIKVQTDQTNEANVESSDLLGAKSGNGINVVGNNIEIDFKHLMSKLHVNYKFTSSNANYSVQSITLNNICVQGGYSYKDMNYVNSSLTNGNIQMLHNTTDKTAEAIFYPYTPTSNSQPSITVTFKRNNTTLPVTVNLFHDNELISFNGGYKYILDLEISGRYISSAKITAVQDWATGYDPMANIRGKKILWIGTSIPSNHADFGQSKSYPTLIAEATGCTIVNKSVAGSMVNFYPSYTTWTTEDWASPDVINSGKEAEAYALSATKSEIKTKYTTILTNLANGRQNYLNAITSHVNRLQQYSYEELIIPYINGQKDNCDVIVIDHGYNDMNYMAMEAFYGNTGLEWLESVSNLSSPSRFQIPSSYRTWCSENNYGSGDKISYIAAMNHIISKCKSAANSNVKIIIGNYFATRTPFYRDNNINGDNLAYIGDCLVKTNEAVADLNGLDIVNVYKYTDLDADNVNHQYYNQVFYGLCPDGIHPGSDPTSTLNKIIANIYIEEFKKIFGE